MALVGTRDGLVIEARPGESVHTPPEQEHWHGAVPDGFMEQLAIWDPAGDGSPETSWVEAVTEEHYARARTRGR